MERKKGPIDFPLFIVILILLSIGINMVFSASMYQDRQFYNDCYYHLKKQIIWAGIGIAAMIAVSNIDYKIFKNRKLISIGMIATFALLLIVFSMPPIKGARRWIGIGGASFQPSEIAKLMIIIYISEKLTRGKDKVKKFWEGIFPIIAISGVFAVLILKEPNMSTAVIIMTVSFLLLFAGGAKVSQLLVILICGIGAALGLIFTEEYRIRRFFGFIDPWADPLDTGFQAIQSLYALGAGGIFGSGFGMSRQKQLYIPEAQTDFIFSILGEELGFLGTAFIIILFVILIWRGLKIALNCNDKFGSLLATGITSLVAVQSSINFLVVSSFMPITGVTLPLISYGGSSLVFTLISLGILLNISRYKEKN